GAGSRGASGPRGPAHHRLDGPVAVASGRRSSTQARAPVGAGAAGGAGQTLAAQGSATPLPPIGSGAPRGGARPTGQFTVMVNDGSDALAHPSVTLMRMPG